MDSLNTTIDSQYKPMMEQYTTSPEIRRKISLFVIEMDKDIKASSRTNLLCTFNLNFMAITDDEWTSAEKQFERKSSREQPLGERGMLEDIEGMERRNDSKELGRLAIHIHNQLNAALGGYHVEGHEAVRESIHRAINATTRIIQELQKANEKSGNLNQEVNSLPLSSVKLPQLKPAHVTLKFHKVHGVSPQQIRERRMKWHQERFQKIENKADRIALNVLSERKQHSESRNPYTSQS